MTKKETYNMNIKGHLRNEIAREIVIGTFKKCGIKGNIYHLKYYRLNCGSVGQEEDDFEIMKKNKAQQVTLIILFTKFDVIVESKTRNSSFISNKSNKVHCYIELMTCIVIVQKTHYYIPQNIAEIDRRWIDIKVTLSDTHTDMKEERK